ncbi:MAG: zinc ribbon domain-containing protein, partial [Lachnospiraceae bacterium]|nr:zinc ribbon domain-containing protein [Lachnospiraceae bacterium]
MGFEQLGKKLAQLGQDTKSGVQKMGASYQVNAKLGDEKKALMKLYAAIGREVYQRYEEAPLEGLEDEFSAVKTTQENISKLSEQLGKLKNVVCCSECGKEAARGEQFCSGCGAKLPEAEEPIKEKVKRDAKEAAGEAGVILEDIAGKTRDFVGGVADRADAFAKGVASRMAKEKDTEEDIVDMPFEEAEAQTGAAAEEASEGCAEA